MKQAKKAPLELAEGEIYAGSITAPNREGYDLILLPGDHDDANWQESMDWAESLGGDLPDRVEQALLHRYLPEQFQKDAYWSNTQRAGGYDCAWCQGFYGGNQGYGHKDGSLRARAVRRLKI